MADQREPTPCHECNRGGNGAATDKCSCGWRQTEPSHLGCYLGEPIPPGTPLPVKPKLTRSQERWRRYADVADCFESFRAWLDYDASRRSEASRG